MTGKTAKFGSISRRRLLATLVEWVFGSARVQPLIIATEDLHWVGPSTLIEWPMGVYSA